MGQPYPDYADTNGDEPTRSAYRNEHSLLASQRDTQKTRRVETDTSGNVYVRVAADDSAEGLIVTPLATGAIISVPASTITTVVTYTAPSVKRVSRIPCSGTIYAKYQLFLNTTLIETARVSNSRSHSFVFEAPLSLSSGDVLDVKVTHYQVGLLENFDATVYGG